MSNAIVKLLAYQKRVVQSTARFTYANWSRQVGKSFAFALRRTLRALDSGRNQILLSAGERQSRELMTKVRDHLRVINAVAEYRELDFEGSSTRQLEATLPNGARIIALPANPQTARGFTGDVLLDEFAMHRDDREIWAALLPTALRGAGQIDVCSTPKGKSNMFYRLASNDSFERSTVTILDAVRDGLAVDVDEIRRATDDEEIWRQEFLCEYIDEAEAFLTFEQIAAVEDGTSAAPLRISGSADDAAELLEQARAAIEGLNAADRIYLGVDVGRKRDLTALWFLVETAGQLATALVVELLNVRFADQMALIEAACGRPNMARCCIDATGMGAPLAEKLTEVFGSRVEGITFTAARKVEMAGRLKARVDARTVRIPADDRIRNDWHSIERIVTTGGSILYRADRNRDGHADRFWAAALAVTAAHDAVAAWDGCLHAVRQAVADNDEPTPSRARLLGVW